MKSTTLDDRRRLVMPAECPANSAVTIQELDEDLWLVRRIRPDHGVKVVAIPSVKKLPADRGREAEELKLARSLSRRLPEPK